MALIIIPAHNESSVIQRCLRSWREAIQAGEIEVIVVANGCTDDTAERAREFKPRVEVLETPVGSKTHALNMGDAAARGWPRVYVDADVVLSLPSLRALVSRLERGDVLAAAPRVEHELGGASWAVRAFYAVDRALPSSREAIGGSGVYAISEEGRKRWGKFPKITADDGFVRRHFAAHERTVVQDAVSVVTPPKRLSGLIAIKTRSHFGTYEVARVFPELTANRGQGNRAALIRLALRPWWWAKLTVYVYVKVIARVRARRRIREQARAPEAEAIWERDESSRLLSTGRPH